MANQLEQSGTNSGERWGVGFASGIIKSSPKVQKAFSDLEAAQLRATAAQREFDKTLNTSKSEAHIRNTERLIIARNNEALAHRNAAAALREGTSQAERASSAFGGLADSIEKNVAGLTGLGRVGIPVLTGLGAILYETAQIAVTASQSIALLPAVAATAAAGLGTLKLATAGFGQAIKDIRDLKKFQEDLYALSPSAQNAALAMRDLLPLFDQIQQRAQENFFSGFGDKIDQFATTFGPGVEKLVGSIATSMNKALGGVFDTLMSSTGQADVGRIFDNIGQAFQNAAPAAQSFSQALLDIATVGSDFLPGFGSSIATVAQEFATFIRNARESGQLKKWIQEGIDAVKGLAGAIKDIGVFIYDVFGGAGQGEVQAWRKGVTDTLNTLRLLLEPVNAAMHLFNTNIGDSNKSLSELMNPLMIIRDLVNSIRWFFDPNYRAQSSALSAATKKLNDARAKVGQPPVDDQGNVIQPPGGTGGGIGNSSDNVTGNRRLLPPSRSGVIGRGTVPILTSPGNGSGWGPGGGLFYDPSVSLPKDPKNPKMSDSDRRDAIIASLDPSLWKVDPYSGLPQGFNPNTMAPGADPQQVLEANRNVLSAAHDLEEDKKKRLALERDNTATQREIDDAKWKELEGGWKLQEAQARLIEEQKGKNSEIAQGMKDLGVAIDPDFGLSKGLAGFAEEITKFIGNLAAAPMMEQLNQQVQNDPLKGGFGLLGIRGAQNIAAGMSPLLGRPLTPEQQAAYYDTNATGSSTSSPSSSPGMPTGTTGSPGAPMPGESARDFAHRVMLPFWQSKGLTVGDHAADQFGEHQHGALDIMVPNLATGSQVLQQALSDPNVYGAIFNNQTYGYGHGTTPQDYKAGHTGDPNQDHQNHVHVWYKPGDPNDISPIPGGAIPYGSAGSTASFGGGSIPIPLPVTIVGFGAGGGGAAPPGTPASGQGGGPPPGPGGHLADWDKIAGPEAGGNWANTSNPNFSGGLQFTPSSWAAAGGLKFAPTAAQATPEEQKTVADRLLQMQGPGAWPATSAAHPDWFRPPGGAPALPPNVPRGGQGFPLPLTPANPFGPQPRGPGSAEASGTAWVPGAATSEPNANTGIQSDTSRPALISGGPSQTPAGPPITSTSPFGAPDFGVTSPPPGQVGPFAVPPGVAATQGGLGSSAITGLTPGIGPTGPSGWAPPAGAAPNAGQTTPYGGSYGTPGLSGGGGIGITPGGSIDTAMSIAGAGLDLLAPGAGQAAQTGMKLANRAIQYAGQLAGIGVQGLMETFLPTGGSDLANNSWLTRFAGAAAGAIPALPNIAGGKGQGRDNGQGGPPGPLTPEQAAQYAASQGQRPAGQGNVVNVQYDVHGQTEDQNGKALAYHLGQAALPAGVP